MQELKGKGLSPGYASGNAFLYRIGRIEVPRSETIAPQDVEQELHRLQRGIENSAEELLRIRGTIQRDIGRHEAGIFDYHVSVLKDPKFVDKIKERIQRELKSAEMAVLSRVEELMQLFAEMDSEYIGTRALDIQDIGNRLLRHLQGVKESLHSLPMETILVADELFPSDTLSIDRDHLKGIVTERAGATSHATILARGFGIPLVTGIENATAHIEDGVPLLVDGNSGTVVILPSTSQNKSFQIQKAQYEKETAAAVAGEMEACVTLDGLDISLWANISLPSEAHSVGRHNLQGVGLLRTEHLYLQVDAAPDIDCQVQHYKEIAAMLNGAPLTIRTLDLGADNQPQFFSRGAQMNPGMNMRGLRFSLAEESIFKDQITAILRVAKTFPVRILLPMVTELDDLIQAKALIAEIAGQADMDQLPPVGAMIETPSAVMMIEDIAAESDFLSIGTNDLAQFMLAADRLSTPMIQEYFPLHPAMLRAIRIVTEAASKYGIPLYLCGEIAGDPVAACILVGLDIRNLSMSPVRAARVRQALRRSDSSELKELADKAAGLRQAKDMHAFLGEMDALIR